MKGLMLLANGFEDTEALTTRDVLLRAGIEVITYSINSNRQVESSFGLTLLADKPFSLLPANIDSFDFLILPGGGRGTKNLAENRNVRDLIEKFYDRDKLLCAICAAPSIFGKLGYFKDTKFTCFAGFNQGYEGIFTGEEVVVDGNFITARSMMYSVKFALAIIEKLLGSEVKEKVLIGLQGQVEK